MTNLPKPCGTLAAYARHLRHHEVPCDDCTRANREAKRQRGTATPSLRKPINHGTPAGYRQHRYRREQACDACLTAENNRRRAYQALSRKTGKRVAS